MIVPHARCGGYGWVYIWRWDPHTHVPSRRKWRCSPCRSTGYMTIKTPPQKPLPDAARVEAVLRRRKYWQNGDALGRVRVTMFGAPECASIRLGLYVRGELMALIRETRAGAVYLDRPHAGCVYESIQEG